VRSRRFERRRATPGCRVLGQPTGGDSTENNCSSYLDEAAQWPGKMSFDFSSDRAGAEAEPGVQIAEGAPVDSGVQISVWLAATPSSPVAVVTLGPYRLRYCYSICVSRMTWSGRLGSTPAWTRPRLTRRRSTAEVAS
jgi:hypothetical protein